MTPEQARYLAGICGGTVRDDYSGRGMYGKTTCAVVTESSLTDIICELWGSDDEGIPSPRSLGVDNMGRDEIVLY